MAYVEAISNGGSGVTAARANAIRSGYFARNRVVVSVNGTQRKAITSGLRISEPAGREPAVADVAFKGRGGFVPDRGQTIIIGHGTLDNRLFAGRIIRATRDLARHSQPQPTYTVEATDTLFDLQRTYPPFGFVARSLGVASIVRGLLSAATPSTTSLGFSAEFVQGDMPAVAEFVSPPTESVVEAFDRLAAAVGATWYSDNRQRIHYWIDADPEVKPTINTLTGTTTTYRYLRRAGEMGRVFSRVVGLGAATTTEHDSWAYDTRVPVANFEKLIDVSSTLDFTQYRGTSTGRFIVDGIPRSVTGALFPIDLLTKDALLSAAPVSKTTNGFWVADCVFDGNLVTDQFMGHQWVGINGDYFRVSSYSGFSSSATTIYGRAFVPSSGPGAPNPTNIGAVPAGTRFTAERAELILAPSSVNRIVPKGASVRVYYDVTSASINDAVQSLCGDTVRGMATDIVDDTSIEPLELIKACNARLYEAHPDRWVNYTLETRDPAFVRGQTVHLSVTNPAEASGPSLAGSFPIQSVDIDTFDEMADSLGPIRRITLGPIAKPSLYLELSRWDV